MSEPRPVHVWEKVEIVLNAERSYPNPYAEVDVWVDLRGPGFERRCYGFWDGARTFRVRVVATGPGEWTWTSASNTSDFGLNGRSGTFQAVEWTEAEKEQNLCRRGFIRPSANGHAFEHADGTPFFLLGDTWWPLGTFRYRWHDDDEERQIGPGMGLRDALRLRREQGFNCIAIIAAFPSWANDGHPARLHAEDGTPLRDAWQQAGTDSAKDMHDEAGNRAFLFPGRAPGYEDVLPDLDRINPDYFKSLDTKVDHLNAQGFIPFIEPARRDIGPAWQKYHDWPDSYARYVQYVWSRYQANNCLYSAIHFDWRDNTIPAEDWNEAGNAVIEKWGPPPFGTLAGPNPDTSSLHCFGHVDRARWLTFHQIGNKREHKFYEGLTEIFHTEPAVPALNGEPFYDGLPWRGGPPGGSEASSLNCRSGMYGSVLSGGLAGHVYGAHGLWAGEVEDGADANIWEAIRWPASGQMQHLRTFVLSEGARYRDLLPSVELVRPNRSGPEMGYRGWAYCARTAAKDLFLLYFEAACTQAVVTGARPGAAYRAQWFDPRSGRWLGCGSGTVQADESGAIALPSFPDGSLESREDWALKLVLPSGT